MVVRKLYENTEAKSEVKIDLPQDKEPVSSYLTRIAQAIRGEQETLREYQMILDCPDVPDNVRNAVNEIIEDEKDHMVIFASLACLELNNAFPKNGDIDPYTGFSKGNMSYSSVVLDDDRTINEVSKLKRKKVKKYQVSESVKTKKISADSLNYTSTYEVEVDIKVSPGNLLKSKIAIEDAIFKMNEDNENINLNLINFTDSFMSYTVKIPEDVVLDGEAMTEELLELASSDYIELI